MIKSNTVADAVEALIGVYPTSGREVVALSFMKWLGVDIDFVDAPTPRLFPMNAEKLVNVTYLESLLHYNFNYPSLIILLCLLKRSPMDLTCYLRFDDAIRLFS